MTPADVQDVEVDVRDHHVYATARVADGEIAVSLPTTGDPALEVLSYLAREAAMHAVATIDTEAETVQEIAGAAGGPAATPEPWSNGGGSR